MDVNASYDSGYRTTPNPTTLDARPPQKVCWCHPAEALRMPLRSVLLALLLAAPARAADPKGVEFFEKRIRPVLVEHCYKCHSADAEKAKKLRGGLYLDTAAGVKKGGDSGPAVVGGDPRASLLIRAMKADGLAQMPPKDALPAGVIADFEAWIKMGAPDPRSGETSAAAAVDFEKARRHWAFRPVAPPPAGATIDALVRARLRDNGLSLAPPADRRTLARRLYFDLTGLPPSPEDVAAFLTDASPSATADLIDKLLASPHYGEKWGRHWLDVVRYADTAGETADFPVPQAWRYRNYVIDAFNADKPFDQFVTEQIAGDILAKSAPPHRHAELVTATGYLAVSRRFGFDIKADLYLTLEDTIDVLGKSLLGLTVGCARCHDHKYDAIPTTDYYALYGIFESTRFPEPGCEKEKKQHHFPALVHPGVFGVAGGLASNQTAYAVAEGEPHDAQLHRRGDPMNRGASVPRRWLSVLGGQPLPKGAGSGRLQLANWLTDPKNPLVARVFVNRVWQHHFGTGLVSTPNDFGVRGSPPSHPELLDYLAARFVAGGWSVKKLHREILLSAAYRQVAGAQFGQVALRRLTAEEIRDSILAVSGTLDRTPGKGHPFPDPKTWQFTQHGPFSAVYDHDRRGVYLMTQRIKRHPFLSLFDGPDPNSSTPHRDATTVPTQSLFFLNDPFVHAKSDALAGVLLKLPEGDRLDRVSRLCYGRAATEAEKGVAAKFVAGYGDPRKAWAAWARVTFASNEFLYVE